MTERLIGLSSEAPGLVAATLLLTIALSHLRHIPRSPQTDHP